MTLDDLRGHTPYNWHSCKVVEDSALNKKYSAEEDDLEILR